MRGFLLVLVALVLVMPNTALGAADEPLPLTEAVNAFNDRAREQGLGKGQALLTEEAVVAAIRWAMLDRYKLQVSDVTFRQLRESADERSLPADFKLEVLTAYEPNDEVTFEVWSVRLRIPGGPHQGGTTCITVAENMIMSRLIGEAEREVIRAWREREQKQGGIGSFERVDWMRQYRKAREEAAARDRSGK